MSSRRWLAAGAVMVACVAPTSLRAQGASDSLARVLAKLALVDSQLVRRERAHRAEEARTAPVRHGRVQVEGPFTLVVHEAVPRSTVARTARAADSVLRDFGAFPVDMIRAPVVIAAGLSDTAALLGGPRFRNRPRLEMEPWPPGDSGDVLGWRIVRPIAERFRESLDTTWQDWLSQDYGLYWSGRIQGEAALSHLANEAAAATGKECLAGTVTSCRYWLGLDRDSAPFEVRYHIDELVAAAKSHYWGAPSSACRQGDGAECVRLFESAGKWPPLSRIPAPGEARSSVLRSVLALHGREAIRRAFSDSVGSVGDRLARAAGVSEDSLVTEWRMWVLSRGRPERVTAGIGEAFPALLFMVVLLGLAVRSGRWR